MEKSSQPRSMLRETQYGHIMYLQKKGILLQDGITFLSQCLPTT